MLAASSPEERPEYMRMNLEREPCHIHQEPQGNQACFRETQEGTGVLCRRVPYYNMESERHPNLERNDPYTTLLDPFKEP